MSFSDPTFLSFLGYLVVVVLVGLLTYRFMRAPGDFFLGGRRLGAWVIAISERASGESAWFLLGLPGLAYASGVQAFWAREGDSTSDHGVAAMASAGVMTGPAARA